MRAAVIDIGSSSTKLAIGEKDGNDMRILENLRNVIDIGKNTFYHGRISQGIFDHVISVLENYKKVIEQYQVNQVQVIATTAVREASNKDIFLDTISRKTGYEIEVLNVGDVVYYIDSFLSYELKEEYPIHEKNVLIAELGAGSLDISIMAKGYTLVNFGISAGTLRLEQFKEGIDGSRSEIYEALDEYVEQQIMSVRKAFPNLRFDDIILIDESHAGALQSILPGHKHDPSFFKVTHRETKKFLNQIVSSNLDDLAYKYQLTPGVADSIDIYAVILNKLFKLIKNRYLYVLKTSLSQALLVNIIFGVELSKKYNKMNQLISVAKFIGQKYNVDLKHNKFVAGLSEAIFHKLKDSLGLEDSDLLYLLMATYLHNIGIFINNRSSHKHAEYIINSLSLFRLTDQEIKMIACIARYHRRSKPSQTHFLYSSLSDDKQILVQKLSAILRLTNALDGSHKQKVKKLEIEIGKDQNIDLIVYTHDNFILEKMEFNNKKEMFEEVSGSRINLVIRHQEEA